MMIDTNSIKVMRILASITNTMAISEIQQLANRKNPDTTKSYYLDVICNKTAKLFEAAAQLGATISTCSEVEEIAVAKYGENLGIAFQLIDDVLDYSHDPDTDEDIGDDLAECKPTLPLLYAMWHSPEPEANIIRNAIKKGKISNVEIIRDAIKKTGALEYTVELAKKKTNTAIEQISEFPDSKYLEAFHNLAKFSVQRAY